MSAPAPASCGHVELRIIRRRLSAILTGRPPIRPAPRIRRLPQAKCMGCGRFIRIQIEED